MENNYFKINSLVQENLEQLSRITSKNDGLSGIASGFHELDKITSGWQKGNMIVIASRPSMGKSAFALSIIKNLIVNYKTPTLLFSLEMNNMDLINRLMVNVCEIPIEKIMSGQLAPYEWGLLDYKIKNLSESPLFIDHTPGIDIDELCEKTKLAVINEGVKIVFIDNINRISLKNGSYDKRYMEINYMTRKLKDLALELNIPVIVLSNLNRAIESREGLYNKRPELPELRDSGTLEDDADIVLLVHRPEYYKIYQDDKGNDFKGMAEIIIAKHRNGCVGNIMLRFQKEFMRFENPEDNLKEQPTFNRVVNIPPPPII